MLPEYELATERRRQAQLWAQHAHEIGATHAFTFNPDYAHARRRGEAEEFIRRIARRLYKELNRSLRGFSRRDSVFDDPNSVRFIGAYELKDRRGLLYPHGHLAIALRPGEDVALHQFMMARWGSMERCPRTGREDYHPAFRSPLFADRNCRPEYHLAPIHDLLGWTRYAAQSDEFTVLAFSEEFLKPLTVKAA